MKNYHKLILSLLLIITVLMSCKQKEEQITDEHENHTETNLVELTSPQYEQAGITLGTIERRTIGSLLKVNGKLELPPESDISISAPYGGFIKRTEILAGSSVQKGQVVALIENPEFLEIQQSYLESFSKGESLLQEYQRKERLHQEQVASAKSYQAAKTAYKVNEAALKSAEAKLKLIGLDPLQVMKGKFSSTVNVYAPINGRIEEVYINVGRYVSPRDVIMDIADTDHLHVELTVYENDISKLAIGQKVWFAISGDPEKKLEAEIYLLGAAVREDRSITVHAHLKGKADHLLPGMYISAEIQTGSIKTSTLPEKSIVRYQGSHYVFKYLGDKMEDLSTVHQFAMIEIEKGVTENEITGIKLLDLEAKETDQFVMEGAFTVLAAMKNEEGEGHH